MKQVDERGEATTSDGQQMSTDYLLLHTAFKAGEQERRRRQSVPRIHVANDDDLQQQQQQQQQQASPHHRRTHSLKCSSSSSSPAITRRQSAGTCRRAGSVRSTPPRPARNASNASPNVPRPTFSYWQHIVYAFCILFRALSPTSVDRHFQTFMEQDWFKFLRQLTT